MGMQKYKNKSKMQDTEEVDATIKIEAIKKLELVHYLGLTPPNVIMSPSLSTPDAVLIEFTSPPFCPRKVSMKVFPAFVIVA